MASTIEIHRAEPQLPTYRRNRWHLAALGLIAISSALLAYPYLGQAEYALARASLRRATAAIASAPADLATPDPVGAPAPRPRPAAVAAPSPTVARPQTDQLRLPTIGVMMDIVEGRDAKASLRRGAWRLPGTSTPDRGGNTVLAGHRWLYRPPSARTLYNLDKVAVGDPVEVDWRGSTYRYRVREIAVVSPDQIEILQNTAEDIITIFTCTPLFSSAQRLVVIAERV